MRTNQQVLSKPLGPEHFNINYEHSMHGQSILSKQYHNVTTFRAPHYGRSCKKRPIYRLLPQPQHKSAIWHLSRFPPILDVFLAHELIQRCGVNVAMVTRRLRVHEVHGTSLNAHTTFF